MDYPKFMELSAEMKVQIIRKCYPIPYVRLRQSCRHLDDISEQNGKKFGIYCYRDEPHLLLTNTLSIEPFEKVEDLDGPHVVVASGKYGNSHNFLVPMTSQNISKIRRSLSGFYFYQITLANSAEVEDYERNKTFGEGLTYFLEMASKLNFRHVTVIKLTTMQIETVLREWPTLGITISDIGRVTDEQSLQQVVQIDAIKKTRWLEIYIGKYIDGITSNMIEGIAQGKETVYLTINGVTNETGVEIYNNLDKIWAKEDKYPKLFYLYFFHALYLFDLSIGYNIIDATNIYNFTDLELNFKELQEEKAKLDVWLAKAKKYNKWKLVSLRRRLRPAVTEVYVCLRPSISTETLLKRLFCFVNTSYPGHARDYSSFYEKVKTAQTVEEIKEEYTKLTKEMLRFYKKIYRRSILNVACELVTEWWNWPRWILEFTKRRPIEKRPPIVDLGYVLFQEILCPIYQYSTMPYSL